MFMAAVGSVMTEPEPDAARTSDGALILFATQRDGKDMLQFVVDRDGRFAWVVARDVASGTVMLDESPVVYVSTYAGIEERLMRRLYPAGDELVTMESSPVAKDASLDWMLTYELVKRHTRTETATILTGMRTPGLQSTSTRMRAALASMPDMMKRVQELKTKLAETPDDEPLRAEYKRASEELGPLTLTCGHAYRWTSAIRRLRPEYTLDDIMRVHGIVRVNIIEMTTPVTHVRYGAALYRAASHMWHSCVPTARAVTGEGGRLSIEALGPLAAGTRLTLNRFLGANTLIRCIKTAPAMLRDTFDMVTGLYCGCTECVECSAWLRRSATPASASPTFTPDIESVERVIEDVWTQVPSKRLIETLPRDSRLRSLIDTPILLYRAAVVEDLVRATTQTALRDMFDVDSKATLASVVLATLVADSAWTPTQSCYGKFDAALVDAALTHLRQMSETVIGRALKRQGVTESLIATRLRAWRARVEYLTVAIGCARFFAALPDDATRDEKVSAAVPLEAAMAASIRAIRANVLNGAAQDDDNVGYASTVRHMHTEQFFAPHVGAVMSLFQSSV
jgi:hypothetical protein